MQRQFVFVMVFVAAGMVFGPRDATAQQSDRFDKWLQPGYFRGFNVGYYCSVSPVVRTLDDLIDLKRTGANLAQIGVYGENFRRVEWPYDEDPNGRSVVTQMVDFCRGAGIHYTIACRTGPGLYDIADEEPTHVTTIWHRDSAAQRAMHGRMLREIAEAFRDDTLFVGLTPVVEPAPLGNMYLGPADLAAALADSGIDLPAVYAEWIDSIRAGDPNLPVIVQAPQLANPEYWLEPGLIAKQNDPRVVYDFHAYEPIDYTHHPVMNQAIYPGTHWNETVQDFVLWDSAFYHNTVFAHVRAFQQAHGVPILMGEFGMRYPQINGETFLLDFYAIAHAYGWHFALWAWRGDTAKSAFEFDYEMFDSAAGGGTTYWEAVQSMFRTPSTGVPDAGHPGRQALSLHAVPNPARTETVLRYELSARAHVTATVYDALGKDVGTLADAEEEPGRHSVVWRTAGYAPGAYLCRITAGRDGATAIVVVRR